MNIREKSLVLILAIVLFIGVSFFATTWLVMILAGMVGHFVNNDWLMHLGFWKCAPVWLMIVILKLLFSNK